MDLHEWGGSFDEISKVLVENGFLTLRFSFASCGKSEGDFRQMTISRQAKQVQDVLDFLRRDYLVDKKRIGILAQSMGSPSVIEALPLKISSLVLLSAVFDPEESLKIVLKERNIAINLNEGTRVPRTDGSMTELGLQIWEDFKKLDLKRKLEKYGTFPILILHGALDTKVPVKDAKQYFKFARGEKEIAIYPKGDHGFDEVSPSLRRKVLEKTVSWYKKH